MGFVSQKTDRGSVKTSIYGTMFRQFIDIQGCRQVGEAISLPATAVLAGLLIIVSFSMSHSIVEIEGTDW